jgi:hypothetical protein
MEVIKRINQSESDLLKQIHSGHKLFSSHIESVLDKPNCYKVNLFASDYRSTWVRTCFWSADQWVTLLEAINHIKADGSFLDQTVDGCLSGTKVRKYWNSLLECERELSDCFLGLAKFNCFMLDRGRVEVTDGMHRLVAYGLATDLNERYFPIPVFLGTDKTL